ncbi:hypothetical protein, partial [Bordetella pertussis]
QAVVGSADPFAALNCQPRQYNDTLSLALTFTQPVDRRTDLSRLIKVVDTGPLAQSDDENAAIERPAP